MIPEERLDSGFELTNEVFQRMLAGAMWPLETENVALGLKEVERRKDRLRRVHDHGRFTTTPPVSR